MPRVFFQDPGGDHFGNASVDELREFIFNGGDDFWNVGSGQGGLDFFENEVDKREKSTLFIKRLEDFGFMIGHRFNRSNENIYTLTALPHTGETVEAAIGGEPNLFYREYFVPRETAWRAIEYFMRTGDRLPELNWEIAALPEPQANLR